MKWKRSLMNHSNWCLKVIYTNGQASTLGQRQGAILVRVGSLEISDILGLCQESQKNRERSSLQ